MSVGRGQAVHQGIHDHLLENSFKPLMGKLTAAHQDGQKSGSKYYCGSIGRDDPLVCHVKGFPNCHLPTKQPTHSTI